MFFHLNYVFDRMKLGEGGGGCGVGGISEKYGPSVVKHQNNDDRMANNV